MFSHPRVKNHALIYFKGGVMKIVVLSDDKAGRGGLLAKHSLSLYIERYGEYILFDLGVDSTILEHNSSVLDVSIDLVDYAVISHEHTPHYGGFKYLSSQAPYTDVYIPFTTSESLGRTLKLHGLKPIEVTKWMKLSDGVYVSKPYYGPPYEHILVLDEPGGLILVTGCLHPGLNALQDAAKTLGKRIKGIIGGLHLHNAPEKIVVEFAEKITYELKPDFIAPLHCSGQRLINILRKHGNINTLNLECGDALNI
jgi:7,8-dihydropterin-6-yl-methyl-4-(beta-D-ribofuranosyl)aminobenzene 5'-phosphate synthase